jgi:hypothetical protein
MHISVHRLKEDQNSTIGFMKIDGEPMYFTLEDDYDEVKKHGSTCIPKGTYHINLRDEGGMTKKYEKKFGADFHKGMLHLQDVPNYEWVYIHMGNTHKHTEGCILVGVTGDLSRGKKKVGRSEDAYRQIYPLIRDAILSGEEVVIEIT